MGEAVAGAARVPRVVVGAALCLASWAAFSLQDVLVKSLVVDLPVPEVLFVRSCVIVAISIGFLRRPDWSTLAVPAHVRSIALRSGLILVAWGCYYTASRSLHIRLRKQWIFNRSKCI